MNKAILLLLLSISFNQLVHAGQEGLLDISKLGYMYDQSQDYKRAFSFYTKAAEQGNAISQYNLRIM